MTRWGCCCDSVVLASDYVQAAAVETVHTAHHWLSEGPCVSAYDKRMDICEDTISIVADLSFR